jgi:hypothetical protein
MLDELAGACDRGRCAKFLKGMPEEDTAAMLEQPDRLRGVRLIVCQPEGKKEDV